MKRIAIVVVALAIAVPLYAQEKKDHIMFATAGEMTWAAGPPSLPKGAQMAVLEGSPMDEGIFTIRLKMPANYRISPHWHPAFEHITVIEGGFWMGRGEKFDEAALHEIKTGGFSVMAPGTRHYATTKVDTVIQLHGMGPWQLYYVNPEDDPRRPAVKKE